MPQVLPAAVYSCKALGSVLAGATSAAEKAFEAVRRNLDTLASLMRLCARSLDSIDVHHSRSLSSAYSKSHKVIYRERLILSSPVLFARWCMFRG